MMNQISGIPMAPAQMPIPPELAPTPAGQPGFKQFLLKALDHVNAAQQQADLAVEQLMTGEEVNPAEVLTAVQKADLTYRMVMQIRNKLVQAYQDIKDIRI